MFSASFQNSAAFAAVDNTFAGASEITDAGTTIVDIGNGVQIEAGLFQEEGEASILVSPQDIILSKKQLESSARNVFKGRITQISDLGSLVKLTVDVGKPSRFR